MTPCTKDFPVSIGDRVFSPQLGRVGHVVALTFAEHGQRMARIEFKNSTEMLMKTWVNCNRLEDPQPTIRGNQTITSKCLSNGVAK